MTIFCCEFIHFAMWNKVDCGLISSGNSRIVSFVLNIPRSTSYVRLVLCMKVRSNSFLIWLDIRHWLLSWVVFSAYSLASQNFAILPTQEFVHMWFLRDPVMCKTKLFSKLLILRCLFQLWFILLLTPKLITLSWGSLSGIFHMSVDFRLVK